MAGNTFGTLLRLTTFGESHGVAIGGILDGLPAGFPLELGLIQSALDRRKPGTNNLVSPRKESDELEILSGYFEGKTIGTPLAFMVRNHDQKSQDYDLLKEVYRPGHGDYTYAMKYGHRDHRGGGRASARETLSRVIAGSISWQILQKLLPNPITIRSCLTQLGPLRVICQPEDYDWDFSNTNPFLCPCPETLTSWKTYFDTLRHDGLSCGATIYVEAIGFPAGLGEPVFDKLDADLAKAMMGINAVKSVSIGQLEHVEQLDTSFDEFTAPHVFATNKAGGVLAGISSGQNLVMRIAFKATSSTKRPRTVATTTDTITTMAIDGRHDPCVALRAPVIVESMVALTLLDHALRFRGQMGHNFSH